MSQTKTFCYKKLEFFGDQIQNLSAVTGVEARNVTFVPTLRAAFCHEQASKSSKLGMQPALKLCKNSGERIGCEQEHAPTVRCRCRTTNNSGTPRKDLLPCLLSPGLVGEFDLTRVELSGRFGSSSCETKSSCPAKGRAESE